MNTEPFEYINQFYGIRASLDQRVTIDGKAGIIVADLGHRIGVRFDNDPNTITPCHPAWEVIYHGDPFGIHHT